VDNLGNLGGAKVAYITSGLQSKWGDIFLVTSSNGVFSFSADMGCVEAHKCLLGMKSDPSVEIILSKSATSASGVKIKAAFKLMVKEI
jgi:hypothetical protein